MTEEEKQEYINIAKRFGPRLVIEDLSEEYVVFLGKALVDYLTLDLQNLPVAEEEN